MDRFGPNTEAVEALVARIAALTSDEIRRLGAAWRAARGAAWRAAWDAAGDAAWAAGRRAAWRAAWDAARGAAWGAAWRAAGDAARGAAWDAAWDAAGDAARALVTWDLATEHGPYTAAQRDLLAGPWAEVIGLPAELVGG